MVKGMIGKQAGRFVSFRRIVGLGILLLCPTGPLVADEIPENLPNLESIIAYQSYLETDNFRAFAIARDGAYAYAFGAEDAQAAKNNALSACNPQEFLLHLPCDQRQRRYAKRTD